jgi:two-component sensor histidine kinase
LPPPTSFVRHRNLMHTPEGVNERRQWQAFVSELHHRLKNSLQMITSIIALQESRITDPQVARAIRSTHNRVRAIASMFGPNSTPDLTTVNFGDYLPVMIRELVAEYSVSDRVETEIRTTDLAVDLDQAIPLALIASELVTNALEHAFPADRGGKICIALSYAREPANACKAVYECGLLEVEDDGAPLPAMFDLETAESTGLYLVRNLTLQLRATISAAERAPSGKRFLLTFPIEH